MANFRSFCVELRTSCCGNSFEEDEAVFETYPTLMTSPKPRDALKCRSGPLQESSAPRSHARDDFADFQIQELDDTPAQIPYTSGIGRVTRDSDDVFDMDVAKNCAPGPRMRLVRTASALGCARLEQKLNRPWTSRIQTDDQWLMLHKLCVHATAKRKESCERWALEARTWLACTLDLLVHKLANLRSGFVTNANSEQAILERYNTCSPPESSDAVLLSFIAFLVWSLGETSNQSKEMVKVGSAPLIIEDRSTDASFEATAIEPVITHSSSTLVRACEVSQQTQTNTAPKTFEDIAMERLMISFSFDFPIGQFYRSIGAEMKEEVMMRMKQGLGSADMQEELSCLSCSCPSSSHLASSSSALLEIESNRRVTTLRQSTPSSWRFAPSSFALGILTGLMGVAVARRSRLI